MKKGMIRKLTDISDELAKVQDDFILDAEKNYEKHFQEYEELEPSFKGKYICSDLFKMTFPLYARDIESVKKYAKIVHNPAAVLSGEYFNRQINKENVKKCIFLSGIPGAGKTYFVQSLILSGDIDNDTIIFEGDITSPTIYEKMDMCVANNIEIYVIIINPTLKLAMKNVIMRSEEIGRGASCPLMSRIIGNIPSSLDKLSKKYDIELGIYNKFTNQDVMTKVGIEHISDLDHGTYEEILSQLEKYREEILSLKEEKETNDEKQISR